MKKIKDPIYGYIKVEDKFISIIDSANFQRLRNVIQTSYSAIYPSSLHNRFTHSLGVYNLGVLAFEALENNCSQFLSKITDTELKNIKKVFLFACLCHDIGHSPFSHTGEKFFDKRTLSKELDQQVNDKNYSRDLAEKNGVVGKEHEIMSALLTLRVFPKFIEKKYFDFFSRCIIGLQYKFKSDLSNEMHLKRACIELLNSNIIDVDKLDYLIRDSYMAGFDSVSIDYNRLLNGISINIGEFPILYKKSTLSVLESVLNAHDMERRWVQAHPVILYESYLIKRIIKDVDGKFNLNNNSILTYKALVDEGLELKSIGTLRYLSDSDILFLAKLDYNNNFAIDEYLDRRLRRHPIWKTEAEYNVLFNNIDKDSQLFDILAAFESTLLSGTYGTYSINNVFYEGLKKEIDDTNNKMKKLPDGPSKETFIEKLNTLKVEIKLVKELKKFFNNSGLPFDLIVVSEKQFKRNILKSSFEDLPIKFDDLGEVRFMKDISPKLLDISDSKKYFYFYYKRVSNKQINIKDFCKVLKLFTCNIE